LQHQQQQQRPPFSPQQIVRSQINVGSPSIQNYSRFPIAQTNATFGTPPPPNLDKRRQIQPSDLARIQNKTM
jgi:hypothetical protein